jgi:hypothetical protein
MTTGMVPADFEVPSGLEHADFHLRMLSTHDAEADYEAVTESAERLRSGSPTGWPRPGFTLAENRDDLARHEAEFAARTAFAYTMVDPADERVLGCVYLNPSASADADVHMWVRDSRAEALTKPLVDAVDAWLAASWPFETVNYVRTEYYQPPSPRRHFR